MDTISFFAGVLVMFIVIWIVYQILTRKPEQIELFEEPIDHRPYCPVCECYNITLVDDQAGVPWLKGHIDDLDYYRCNRCGHRFADED